MAARSNKRQKCEECCAICLGTSDGDVMVTPCSHVFHKHCLAQWMACGTHSDCPLCRLDMFDYESLLRRDFPIMFGEVGSAWRINVQTFQQGDITLNAPSQFVVLENNAESMRFQLVDGMPKDIDKGYIEITKEGILTMKKCDLIGVDSQRDEDGPPPHPIHALVDAKAILTSTTIGSFLSKLINNKLNGSLWNFECEIENGEWGYKLMNYQFIIIGHDGNNVRMRFLAFSAEDYFHDLDFFVRDEEAAAPFVITVDYKSLLTYVHHAELEKVKR